MTTFMPDLRKSHNHVSDYHFSVKVVKPSSFNNTIPYVISSNKTKYFLNNFHLSTHKTGPKKKHTHTTHLSRTLSVNVRQVVIMKKSLCRKMKNIFSHNMQVLIATTTTWDHHNQLCTFWGTKTPLHTRPSIKLFAPVGGGRFCNKSYSRSMAVITLKEQENIKINMHD